MIRKLLAGVACILLFAVLPVAADTSLNVDIGWGGHTRPHRWIPVMVTASDPRTRNVELEVYWPHGGNYAMRVRQVFAIGPTPSTFSLVLPSHTYYAFQEAVFTLRDAESGRTIARFPPQPGNWQSVTPVANTDSSLIGVSGQPSNLESLRGNLAISVDYLSPAMLPTAALGYDSLDLLVLNQPNLSLTGGARPIDAAQQQAIVDWVRAGGNLIAWPSAVQPFASSSPLADVFPCRLGERRLMNFAAEDLHALGLGPRFAKMAVFDCTAEAGAEPIRLFNGHVTAYAKRFGLGRIVVAPICVGDLIFDEAEKAQMFWQPLVAGMHVMLAAAPPAQVINRFGNSPTRDDQKETAATMRIADRLGDVPGAGEFGFAYVVIALAGMMIVVGPVDWWVLKKLGRQPWTWVTTSGWILLVTFAAVSAGYLFKSGELHYRTLRLVDQVGDETVASIDCLGIYSPRTQQYSLAADPESWWQPSGVEDYSSGGMPIEVGFHQTYQGNTPESMGINVWSLRFLRGDQIGVAQPAIAASLSQAGNPDRIIGVIKNLTDRPLKNLRVRFGKSRGLLTLRAESPTTSPTTAAATDSGGAVVTQIAPFATVRVEATLSPDPAAAERDAIEQNLRYGFRAIPPDADPWEYVGWLDMRRATRIDDILHASDRFACIYAESVDPPTPVRMMNQTPLEQHMQFVRALIDLKTTSD